MNKTFLAKPGFEPRISRTKDLKITAQPKQLKFKVKSRNLYYSAESAEFAELQFWIVDHASMVSVWPIAVSATQNYKFTFALKWKEGSGKGLTLNLMIYC